MKKQPRTKIVNKLELTWNNIFKIVVLIYVIIFFIGGCYKEHPTSPPPIGDLYTLQIKGTVTDIYTSRPLLGASVEFCSSWGGVIKGALTNEEGHYFIKYESYGECKTLKTFWIVASKQGYMSQWIYGETEGGFYCTEEIQTVDIQLEPF